MPIGEFPGAVDRPQELRLPTDSCSAWVPLTASSHCPAQGPVVITLNCDQSSTVLPEGQGASI